MPLRSGITFIIGGSRSGKSSFAESLASEPDSARVLYIATAEAGDPEMASRIAAHKARRPPEWSTWEGNVKILPREIGSLVSAADTLLLDSLATYLSGMFITVPESSYGDEKIWPCVEKEMLGGVREIFSNFRESEPEMNKHFIVVSDEVGCGVIPPYPMGRRFRDLLGAANQIAAGLADQAALVTAGIPLWIKVRG
ncbi:MAG: bifunctional adenosylcobinamide kinase/adenosylcobinamide-phosphate guanylyltransferase [Synergistaceae bacterium]|jgi:adenosylcobinamide kinase/adenosylcobinamide-phosphate guanylyltransferase|nr:bifunctional adenosylcobinamide kinase/adenosylcobinamide-phosphate guanylyltransferase [Synergistaceae bacterium]